MLSRTLVLAGLKFTSSDGLHWRRGKLRVFQHAEGRWIAAAPGISAVANQPAPAVKLLRERVASAAKDLNLNGAVTR